jgi:hypothetical protein
VLAAFAAMNPGRLATYLLSGYAALLAYGSLARVAALPRVADTLPAKATVY